MDNWLLKIDRVSSFFIQLMARFDFIARYVARRWSERNIVLRIQYRSNAIIKKLVASGCVVVMTTNTIFGRVHMHVYDKGTDLVKLGVIPGGDMLAETAFVKLAWLLGNYKAYEAKELIGKNLRGEINTAIAYNEDFTK